MRTSQIGFAFNIDTAAQRDIAHELESLRKAMGEGIYPIPILPGHIDIRYYDGFDTDSGNPSHANVYLQIGVSLKDLPDHYYAILGEWAKDYEDEDEDEDEEKELEAEEKEINAEQKELEAEDEDSNPDNEEEDE